jgi:hypothetical protein
MTGENAYCSKDFSFDVNASQKDLQLIYEHMAYVIAVSFAEIPDIKPINDYVDHILQYEIFETTMIGIAVVCQVALLISYAAS